MQEKCKFKTVMMGKITILLFFISLVAPCQITFADQKSHYAVARQLVELTYNENSPMKWRKNLLCWLLKIALRMIQR
jgi:hypothetical protein